MFYIILFNYSVGNVQLDETALAVASSGFYRETGGFVHGAWRKEKERHILNVSLFMLQWLLLLYGGGVCVWVRLSEPRRWDGIWDGRLNDFTEHLRFTERLSAQDGERRDGEGRKRRVNSDVTVLH